MITAILVGCALAGAILGYFLLTGDWSPARRILAGGLAGAGVGLLMTTTKMIG